MFEVFLEVSIWQKKLSLMSTYASAVTLTIANNIRNLISS